MQGVILDIKVKFVDHSYCKVFAEQYVINEMRDYFSFRVKGYQFNKKYKHGLWDGYIRIMDFNGNLPVGLVDYVKRFANNMDYSVEIDEQLAPKIHWTKEEFDEWIGDIDVYDGDKKITPYDEQKACVYEFFNRKRMISEVPTSGGKSLIAALCSKRFFEFSDQKVLIIVPTVMLVNQFTDELINYRIFDREDVHKIKSGTAKDSSSRIYVSTWQSAVKQPASWFKQFGMLINDECHDSTGKSLDGIIKTMTETEYKQGLTGTLREGKANLLQYIGSFGTPFKPTTTKQMMDEGKISKLRIKTIFMRYPLDTCKAFHDHKPKIDYQKEIKFITKHKKRNRWIAKLASKLAKRDENVLVLFKHISHGKELFEMIKKEYGDDRVIYASGETSDDDRELMKKSANDGSGIIVVASFGILSTGVSIKKLHHAIFTHPTKSKITTMQSVGRILRKHENKNGAVLWDLIDHLALPTRRGAKSKWKKLNYSLKHGIERVRMYNKEQFDYDVSTKEIK